MNRKVIAILGIVFVVLTAMYFVTPSGYEASDTSGEKQLFRDVSADSIAKIELKQANQIVLVEAKDGQWIVPSRGSYKANAAKVKSTLLKLLDLSVSQFVTDNESHYTELGVADESFKGGRMRLALQDKEGKEIAALLIGEFRKKRNDATVLAPQGQYLRRVGDKNVYMTGDPLALSGNVIDWMDTIVSNVLQSQVDSVEEVISGGGDPVIIKRTGVETEGKPVPFTLQGVAAGEKVAGHKVSQLASGLENLRFSDVLPTGDANVKDLAYGVVTTYYLSNGLNYIAETAQRGDKIYLRLRVVFDESRAKELKQKATAASSASATTSAASSDSMAGSASSGLPQVQLSDADTASKLTANYAPWIFELPQYLGQKLRLTKSDLIEKNEKK